MDFMACRKAPTQRWWFFLVERELRVWGSFLYICHKEGKGEVWDFKWETEGILEMENVSIREPKCCSAWRQGETVRRWLWLQEATKAWRLATSTNSPSDSYMISGLEEYVRLAIWTVARTNQRRCAPSGVIYKAFGDASKVGLLVFLELWLGIIASLELWLGMADEHEGILSCGLG
ncbi:hypothetical protein DEO72_LG8g2969 [Vigna unguiculata]|uniref:Uncharacterized protein n=1 Tax=Vigna unguiculata TaxID=3917 RepID=A0A4D6MYI7_VIGUN|nr:hypothetical protein DEO72_LG8g2969 [Vigna unguiculata]